MINFRMDAADMVTVMNELAKLPQGMEKAFSGAANRAAAGMRTDAVRLVREQYAAKSRDVRDQISLNKATQSRLEVAMYVRGYANISLLHFAKPPHRLKRRPKIGHSVLVKKASGKKAVRGAFYVREPSGGGEFLAKRTDRKNAKGKFIIEKLWTAAPIRFLGQAKTEKELFKMGEARLYKEFGRYSNALLEKAGLR